MAGLSSVPLLLQCPRCCTPGDFCHFIKTQHQSFLLSTSAQSSSWPRPLRTQKKLPGLDRAEEAHVSVPLGATCSPQTHPEVSAFSLSAHVSHSVTSLLCSPVSLSSHKGEGAKPSIFCFSICQEFVLRKGTFYWGTSC